MNTSQAPGTEASKSAAPATSPAHTPGRGSPLRLGILLLVLAACIGALIYDFKVAKPASEAANVKIQNLVQARNQMSVKEAGPVTSKDIQKELGRSPTWVEEEPTHTIEWYCWWGKTPLFSTRRHYITVLYVGDSRRFNSQTLNGPPAEEELPTYVHKSDGADEVGPLSPPTGVPANSGPPPGVPSMGGGGPPGMGGGMPPGAGGKGKVKGKGKGKSGPPSPGGAPPPTGQEPPPAATSPAAGDTPTTSEPAAEKPAAESPPDKPAAEPAPETPAADSPPASDKPESERPAPDSKPAESAPKGGDES